ncbi:armadillo-type protein [Paraphysoderma sedebokerense]|nr:armadillo-type protein [Paraphysoderma sedebokerense]KAI9145353.1 armadillo-type protein [Paraphysoderma sedebokerense]
MADLQDDFTSLPLSDRLTHKVWKARVSAYEELCKSFKLWDPDTQENEYRKYQDALKKMIADSNLVAQESGLMAVQAWLENAPTNLASKSVKEVVSACADKCFGSSRAGTKAKSLEICLICIEIMENGDAALEYIIPALDNKQPKLVTQTIITLKSIVQAFGVKTVNAKPVLKILSKIFGHSDKNVRAEATNLTLELYRWIGDAIQNFLSDLKPVQLKELNDAFAQYSASNPSRPQPERYTRSQQAKIATDGPPNELSGSTGNSDEALAQAEPAEIDSFDLSEPVDLLSKIPSNFYNDLGSTKWKERKEALESVLNLAKVPRLKDDRYHELVGALAKRINDTNILVATTAVQIVECLAKGLRQDFSQYRSHVVSVLLEKLKEKKQTVVDTVRAALDAVYTSTNLSVNLEDITAAANHKNPQIKAESVRWLTRCLTKARSVPTKGEIKNICDLLLKTYEDSTIDVRDSSAEALGTLMRVVGERPLAVHLEKLDKIKMAKVQEYFEKAETRLNGGGSKKPANTSTNAAPALAKATSAPKLNKSSATTKDKENSPPETGRTSAPSRTTRPPSSSATMKKKTGSTGSLNSAAAKKTKSNPSIATPADEPVRLRYTDEDAEDMMKELVGENILKELGDSNWKVRLAAVSAISDKLGTLSVGQVDAEIVTRVLNKKPGYRDNNFQVCMKVFSVLNTIAEWPTFNTGVASLAIPGLIDKLNDMKVKKLAADTLTKFAEYTTLQFVLKQSYEPLKSQKSPKVLIDGIMWINSCLLDFGVAGVALRDLIECIKNQLGNTNPKVREAAIAVLTTMRIFVGPDIRSFIQDINPAQLSTIDAEFDKVADRTPPKPCKTQGKSAMAASASLGGGASESSEAVSSNDTEVDMMDDLFPRVDISSQISGQLLQDLNDGNWKVRKEALENVLRLIEAANKRIKPTVGDLFAPLKARLADSNKNLAIMTLELSGTIATAMGKPFSGHIQTIVPGVCACVADNKAHVRAAAINCLNNILAATSLELLVPTVGNALAQDNPNLRKDLLKWLIDQLGKAENKPDRCDLSSLVTPVISSLQHRDADVRKQAQAMLNPIVQRLGYEHVRSQLGDMKAASAQGVLQILDQVRSSTASSTSASVSKAPSTPRAANAPSPAKASSAGGLKGKPAVRKAVPAPVMKLESAAPPEPTNEDIPIITSDLRMKDRRAESEKHGKWVLDGTRPDLVDYLRDQMTPHFGATIMSQLFSTDHHKEKEHLAAINLLNDCISKPDFSQTNFGIAFDDMKQRALANSDLILKYMTLRFMDTNTSMLLKCLDLLENLCSLWDGIGYCLIEYEAAAFLPSFIGKVGDNKETIRTRIRGIMKQFTRIYPASKMFKYLLDCGPSSKNARTRTECLDELGCLIQRNGLNVCQPAKALPEIAKCIGDRDSSVRNAALGALVQAYLQVGEDAVMKHIGRLSPKDKSLLEERLKRTKPANPIVSNVASLERKTSASSPRKVPRSTAVPSSSEEKPEMPNVESTPLESEPQALPRKQFSLDLDKLDLPPPPTAADIQTLPQTINHPNFTTSTPTLNKQKGLVYGASTSQKDYIIDFILTQITSGDAYQSIDALKQLEKLLTTTPEVINPHIDQLVNAITLQVRLAFTAPDAASAALTRLCKHLINALVQLFSRKECATALSKDSLHQLLQELLHRLLDSTLPQLEYGPQLARALNVLMIRILENSDRNTSFSVLLNILEKSSSNLPYLDEPHASAQTKFAELVMKCLWKLTKVLQETIKMPNFKLSQLLFDVHIFLVAAPPSEWKRRATDKLPLGDMPLRTVKTILHELATNLSEEIFEHLGLIQEPTKSYVYTYLRHMLDASKKKMQRVMSGENSGAATPTNAVSSHASPAGSPPMSSRKLTATMAQPVDNAPTPFESSNASSAIPETKQVMRQEESTKAEMVSNDYAQSVDSGISSVQSFDQASSETLKEPMEMLDETSINEILVRIFTKIGSKEESKQGIVELYNFQKEHPYAEEKVNAHLARTGSYFQSYIRRNLSNIQMEESKKTLPGMSSSIDAKSTVAAGSEGSTSEMFKQKLARLQSKINKNPEVGSNVPVKPITTSSSVPSFDGIDSMDSTGMTIRKSETISTFSTVSSSINPVPVRKQIDPERVSVVNNLKERLAKMKEAMNTSTAASSAPGAGGLVGSDQ